MREEISIKKRVALLGVLVLLGMGMIVAYTVVSKSNASKDETIEYNKGNAIIVSGTGSNITAGISNETNASMLLNTNTVNMRIQQNGQVTNEINISLDQQQTQ